MSLAKWRTPLFLFLAFLTLWGSARVYYRLTDDIRIANMRYPLPFEAPWKNVSLSAEEKQTLREILNQPFSYIGKGAQCYAFGSADGQYVIKFFKFKHLKPNFFIEALPSLPFLKEYKTSCIERKKRKLVSVFNGYDLAFQELKEGCALIYLHLVPSSDLQMQAHIQDKIGFKRSIDLDAMVFLIQKKGETLRTRLRTLLKEGRLSEAKESMAKILTMYIGEYQKGLFDHDHGVLHNTGFIENSPFHLDVGKLNREERMKEPSFYKKDLEHVVWKMDVWTKASFPQFYPEISSFLSDQYRQWTGESIDLSLIDPKRFKKRR